jgi:hypothetical protein
VSLGLLVSTISPTEERAMLLIIAVIIPQFLLSGAMVPINDMGGVGPYMTIPATAKWAFGALITTAEVKTGECSLPDLSDCNMPGLFHPDLVTNEARQSLLASFDRYGNIFDVNLPEYWAAMCGLIFAVLLLVTILQKRKDAL